MPGPEARAVPCPLCNEKFFPAARLERRSLKAFDPEASLKFHVKQCEKKRATRIVNCPYCKIEVSQLHLKEHIAKLGCTFTTDEEPKRARNCPKCASSLAISGGF